MIEILSQEHLIVRIRLFIIPNKSVSIELSGDLVDEQGKAETVDETVVLYLDEGQEV